MTEKKKIKKEKADIVLLDIDPEYEHLKIGFGASFYHHDQKLWLSETPLKDPTLIPFDHIVLEEDGLEFDAFYQKKDTHFSIKKIYEGTETIMTLISTLHENSIAIDKKHNDTINILLEEDGLTIRLVNTLKNKRAVITYSRKHGNTFLQRFPDPSMRFALASCTIEHHILSVKCEGPDLYNADNNIRDLEYKWELDVQPELAEAVSSLIAAGIRYS